MSLPRLLKLSEIVASEPHFQKLVEDYVVAQSKGFKWAPIVCTCADGGFIVKDGNHRVAAARRLGHGFILAIVR
jgi:hypothetical protein